ncbi:low-density lipoprotein receptor-related protein 4-like, partial [Lingula anatina]|uniref:Low-density lipoprotein receptor-related protein 4-like n=1 Tax=Lingula anatina TaxID=7574 RepID=A0A2R2MNH2_LINAN
MDTDVIKSVGLDGSAEETLYEFPQAAILQRMALDVSNRLLFVTDDGRTLIGVLDLVGKNFKTVIDSRLYRPRDIEIDPWENRIYWADWGATESINRAYYDGSEREEIVTSYLYFPFGLAIDVPGRKIMWAEGWYEEIEASNLDGSNRDTIYIKRSSFFHGLAISDSNLYFTDTWT